MQVLALVFLLVYLEVTIPSASFSSRVFVSVFGGHNTKCKF